MSRPPEDLVKITPDVFRAFYKTLCGIIIEKEFGGQLPKGLRDKYGNGLFNRSKGNLTIYEYFNTTPGIVDPPKAENYIYNFYNGLDSKTIVRFDKYLLINCLIYMGYHLTTEEEKIDSRKERAEILLRKFAASLEIKQAANQQEKKADIEPDRVFEQSVLTEEVQNKEERKKTTEPLKANIITGYRPIHINKHIPDQDFYTKKMYQQMVQKREQDKKNSLNLARIATVCLIYCGYFLYGQYKGTDPYGDWWIFGISAVIVFLSLLDGFGHRTDHRYDLSIKKLEYYFATGEQEDDDFFLRRRKSPKNTNATLRKWS